MQTNPDGIFNYELHEELGRGTTAVVYRATCKRGRIRNRQVAVKKVSRTSGKTYSFKEAISATSLHSALSHPSILSLISYFDAPSGHYTVLELCPGGTLEDFLFTRGSPLAEDELRGVARSLLDALIYLKKELVLHRDINPKQVLITKDGRVKLSGFGSAIRLTTVDSTRTEFCGSANYVSPEVLLGKPYAFETDLWSLGCILVSCSSDRPAFYGSDPDEVYANICNVKCELPRTMTSEARDLIGSILQKNPLDRLPLHRILSHQFFRSSAVTLLTAQVHKGSMSQSKLRTTSLTSPRQNKQYPTHLSRHPERPRPVSGPHIKQKEHLPSKRAPLEDITNLYSEDSQFDGGDNLIRDPPTRILSAPACARPRLFSQTRSATVVDSRPAPQVPATDAGATNLFSGDALPVPQRVSGYNAGLRIQSSDFLTERPSPRTQLRRMLSDSHALPESRRTVSLPAGRPVLFSRDTEPSKPRVSSQATSATAVTQPRTPQTGTAEKREPKLAASRVDDPRIPALDTRRLKPETHKISRGQLVILPSRSLLVDFREGERRKGGRGKEVLVISSNGSTIDIYDAPHLSTPCCLAEPTATYALSQLPQRFTKQYNDAARLVDQLKSRIPKLVHYTDDAHCTLMANGPPGDIEILVPADEGKKEARHDAIRVRLHRKAGTLELSRYSGKVAKGRKDLGEWTKKVVPLGPESELMGQSKLAEDDLERLAMRHLSEFLHVCEVIESL
ncbi:kinase-like protein [Pilatotrama ljubarskyi]|nr:kinase-like protein [Pilatotrama ljubarskyi]